MHNGHFMADGMIPRGNNAANRARIRGILMSSMIERESAVGGPAGLVGGGAMAGIGGPMPAIAPMSAMGPPIGAPIAAVGGPAGGIGEPVVVNGEADMNGHAYERPRRLYGQGTRNPPKNLKTLLRFTMEAASMQSLPPSELQPMDEERRKFLEEALRGMTVDVPDALRQGINLLADSGAIMDVTADQDVPQNILIAFTNVTELVYDMDIANDFGKMRGFSIFPICFCCENAEVRALACNLLAELCQNNPDCQKTAVQCGILEVLIKFTETETGNNLVKVVYAMSAVVRFYTPACDVFFLNRGCEALLRMLSDEDERVRLKSIYLIKHLVQNHERSRERLIRQDVTRMLLRFIRFGPAEPTEHVLETIQALLECGSSLVLNYIKIPTLKVREIIEAHRASPDLEPDYPEYGACTEILSYL